MLFTLLYSGTVIKGALQSAGYDVVTMDTETNAKAARESLDAL